MMRIGGLASGIDTDSLIKQLVNAAKIPVDRLLQQKQSLEWQRSEYREMNTKLLDFRNNKMTNYRLQGTFQNQKTTITGDATAISAKTNGTASSSSLSVKVTNLAETAAKWSSADIRDTVDKTFDSSEILSSQESKLDGDTFAKTEYVIKINGAEVSIDTSVDSLDSVINRINKDTNVSAFYDEQTGKISFQSKDSGVVNGVDADQAYITFEDDDNFLSNILNINVAGNTAADSNVATDANVTINGLETTRSSNTFSINGIEVTLLKATGVEATVQVTRDTEKILNAVKSFVEDYNEMLGALNDKVNESKHREYKPLTEDQKSVMSDREVEQWEKQAMSGLLKNDSILNKAVSNMRYASISQIEVSDGEFMSLSSIGIKTGSYTEQGKLYISEAKLKEAIDANPEEVVALFTKTAGTEDGSSEGIAKKLYADLKTSLDELSQKAGSPITIANNSFLDKDLERLDDRIEDANRRLTNMEERYYRQFTAMETAMQQLNAQSEYLYNAFSSGQ